MPEESKTPEEKAKSFLDQLGLIQKSSEALHQEVEELVPYKQLDPKSDVGKLVDNIQRLQSTIQRQITILNQTVKSEGGFRL